MAGGLNSNVMNLKPIFHCDAKYLVSGLALGNAPARMLRWRYQHVGIFWHYLTLKFVSSPTPNLKFALPPTPTPDASQWNIGGVGSPTKIFRLGHVHFICVWHPAQTHFSVEYGLKCLVNVTGIYC